MSKYKIGDKVNLRSDLKNGVYYGKSKSSRNVYVNSMGYLKSMDLTISRVFCDYENCEYYYKTLEFPFHISEKMLKCISNQYKVEFL